MSLGWKVATGRPDVAGASEWNSGGVDVLERTPRSLDMFHLFVLFQEKMMVQEDLIELEKTNA